MHLLLWLFFLVYHLWLCMLNAALALPFYVAVLLTPLKGSSLAALIWYARRAWRVGSI
jgi:hypothetical protein